MNAAYLWLPVLLATVVLLAGITWLASRARARRKAARRADPGNDYAIRTDWADGGGILNYSSFVYFDVDRDGEYGVGDRPMAGIMVRLQDEAGKVVMATRTNNAGFANFPMSMKSRKAVIRAAGDWRFSVSVPPGWRATGANEVQARHIDHMPGSPTGLVSREMLSPVGLAPPRSLAGWISDDAHSTRRISDDARPGGRIRDDGTPTLAVLRDGAVVETRTLPPGAAFRVDLPEDADAFSITGGGLDRWLALSPYPVDLGLLSSRTDRLASDAVLETIDFDDVTGRTFRKIPSGHAGLSWRNLNAMARDYTKDSQGYVNGNVSGDHVAYTSSGLPAEFSCDRPFGFHSVMLTAAWLSSEGEVALIESWLGDQLVASDHFALSALTPVHYAPMLRAVTRVRLSTTHRWQLVLDDLVLAR
ncbi:hypothetical protein [Mesorhizobium sp. ES1-1]|uniref:hypothetical protein n=1 Tax=Mesorhizobium sp. ES1-1 TaxID=2876629 RepID=UPI001CCF6217|nr:hypothetical protein [Mesorhizobium sp. ES1-1]MBZ9678649.1 hypothetical protein [Mesorhizobium sp. ES1-1]